MVLTTVPALGGTRKIAVDLSGSVVVMQEINVFPEAGCVTKYPTVLMVGMRRPLLDVRVTSTNSLARMVSNVSPTVIAATWLPTVLMAPTNQQDRLLSVEFVVVLPSSRVQVVTPCVYRLRRSVMESGTVEMVQMKLAVRQGLGQELAQELELGQELVQALELEQALQQEQAQALQQELEQALQQELEQALQLELELALQQELELALQQELERAPPLELERAPPLELERALAPQLERAPQQEQEQAREQAQVLDQAQEVALELAQVRELALVLELAQVQDLGAAQDLEQAPGRGLAKELGPAQVLELVLAQDFPWTKQFRQCWHRQQDYLLQFKQHFRPC